MTSEAVRRRRVPREAVAPLAVGALVAAATAYVGAVDPNRPGHYVTCPLLALTGLACPGCGGLRATHDLVHLDLAAAWSMNPLWVVVAPLLVVLWGLWLVRAWRGTAARARGGGVDVARRARALRGAAQRARPGPVARPGGCLSRRP